MLLEVERVTLRFAGLTALDAVDFSVESGELVGLIGPNGAGKSTFFNVVSGHYAPTEGRVRFAGRDVTGQPPWRLARLGVARTFQTPRVFRRLTVRENVMAALDPHGWRDWMRLHGSVRHAADEWLDHVGLTDLADTAAGELSYGSLRRLEIARACVRDPDLVLLDEPAAGMNASERQQLVGLIRDINDRGHAVLLIEHNMPLVLGTCPRVAVLNFGELIACGTPTEIRSSPDVITAYLGEHTDEDEAIAEEVVAEATR